MRIQINPRYIHLEPFIQGLPDIFMSEGTVIHDGRNMIKVLTPDGGRTLLNVKRYHVPALPNRIIYSLGLRKPKGQRAFDYPARLLELGIDTPEPVAYIEQRRCGLLGYSYFVSLQCPYPHRFYEMKDADEATLALLAPAFARFTAGMHESRIMHLDYSPGNILYDITPGGECRFSVVDINRMYFGTVGMRQGLDNFKRLWGPKSFFAAIIDEYARLRGFDAAEALEFALTRRKAFWTHYSRKHSLPFKLEL